MKVIIAGSRNISGSMWVQRAVSKAANQGIVPTEVVSGGARGVDLLGEAWAERNGIPIKRFLADWEHEGKAAGPIRNVEMANYADALVAIWDGQSRGTARMIKTARKMGLLVCIMHVGG